MQETISRPQNRCGVCGSTSYRYLVARNEEGTLTRTQTLVCDGCGRTFQEVATWREGKPANTSD
ncbi:MAG: DUF1289 domain-containing protein [Gammaproteobacteria bacterium]|nr:DUF1289 domain-containing protein [Gammaproteobacteria bacterium]MBU4279948.1 DUF1289 domain-containing protein [Gammaproteobacteria bacterium]MBU4505875.1 DUF1289 domain-containing protein [Gammaproteobacteria bacterium]